MGGNHLILDKFTSWEEKKKNITLSQSHNRPNPWEKKTVCWTRSHPSAESIFAHSKLAGIKCTYLFWKEFRSWEVFYSQWHPFDSSWHSFHWKWKFLQRNLYPHNLITEKQIWRWLLFCLWVPPPSGKLHFRFHSEGWPSVKSKRKFSGSHERRVRRDGEKEAEKELCCVPRKSMTVLG